MLKSLRTKNFRKLEDNLFEFERGMVVIRGANEAGKSTLTEAIGYALGGIKSCRGSLAEVVTYGKADTTLAVELVMSSDEVDYTIKRSKSGAEINYEGGRVTGQNECSSFIESLFGVNNGNIGKLITSAQGDIRGALAQGPKATMELIENLANFDLIDNVVDLVQTNLLTGPVASAEAVMQAADLRLQLVKAQVTEPDTTEYDTLSVRFTKEVAELKLKAEAMVPELAKAKEDLILADAEVSKSNKLTDRIHVGLQIVRDRQASIAAQQVIIDESPDTEDIIKAEKDLADALNSDALTKEWATMTKAMDSYPEDFWEGSEESLDKEETSTFLSIGKLKENTQQLVNDVRLFESQKVSGSVCGFCNQDVSKFPEIAEKNSRLSKDIAESNKKIAEYKETLIEAEGNLQVLQGIQKSNVRYLNLESINVKLNTSQVPVSLSWIGKVPVAVDASALQDLKSGLKTLEAARSASSVAGIRKAAEQDIIKETLEKVAADKAELATYKIASAYDIYLSKYNEVNSGYQDTVEKTTTAQYQVDSIAKAILADQVAYDSALSGVADAEQDVAIAKRAVDDLVFNNALIKRLRAARPLIADKLWNVVLSAVSSYFSAMRGVVSVVSKASDGFKVDGQSVEGLSGSTLDILGLAIRLALTRTFIPAAPFLILDEPSAAMDDKRSQEMVGFLLAFGFTQTLMVTHKEINEGAANQLITI